MEQRSEEWFNARRGMVTGSIAGAIIGKDPYKKPEDVMRDMVLDYHGVKPEQATNPALEYGRFHEEMALQDLKMTHPDHEFLGQGFQASGSIPWLGASPDGLVVAPDGQKFNLEIKCPYGMRDEKEPEFKPISELPHYYAQVHVEMFCQGTGKTWFYQWNTHNSSLEVVEFDQSYFFELVRDLSRFYERFCLERQNPEAYLRNEMTTDTSVTLVQEYFELKDSIDTQKERQAEILRELVERSGGVNSEINGHKLTKVVKKGTVSYAKVVKDNLPDIDLTPYTGKPTEYWRLS